MKIDSSAGKRRVECSFDGGDLDVTAGDDLNVTVTDDATITIADDIELAVGGNTVLDLEGSLTIQSAPVADIEADTGYDVDGVTIVTNQVGDGTTSGSLALKVDEITFTCLGASETIPEYLADKLIIGMSAVVTTLVTGATSWDLGHETTGDLIFDGVDVAAGTSVTTTSSTDLADANTFPFQASSDTDLILAAVGGDFTAGVIKIAVWYYSITAPTA